ncbi:YkgJ family cysteine cluster protein [Desulfococcus sp.]|uniref:YkgJ family cysteine cluster protein n=1 Tax=Desulfococcus sp. TaxID=2025834 RepID=UPI0035948582
MDDNSTGGCRRCGTCCRKGGPSLHLEDRRLVDEGILPPAHLFTIRGGEPAHDNIRGGIHPVDGDLIKIRGAGDAWTCIYYDEVLKGCRIYENRPLECRVLKCWDTTEIEAVCLRDRLTRKMLLGGAEGLWELIEDHQARCGYNDLPNLLAGVRDRDPAAVQELREKVLYDIHLRVLVVERGLVAMEMTGFLFGRPLVETLRPLGVACRMADGRLKFFPEDSGAADE